MRILLIEDEINLATAVSAILTREKYQVEIKHDGVLGLDEALTDSYDLILLDIMLPELNGLSVLKELRLNKINTPVLLLTAKGDISDKVTGLDLGADDYLPKPFSTDELLARIRALLRRKDQLVDLNKLTFGDVSLNTSTLDMSRLDKKVRLSPKECDVLAFLMLRKGIYTSKEIMIEKLWGFDSQAQDNHVEVYISFLRKKLIYLKSNVTIRTMRGVGYVLEENQDV
ncbi:MULTISPECIES: response regulator transcription factor [unclassified Fusibacter]|uniref:response regulator transcription factor n=1 Tax=unclassified Fusibacter TaxID=2624464 RepID=UPI001012BB00|nr:MULTISPECIES: response regulator transcription factor [unclassified Fusibacter]MCK8060200.1 response regulator transcription factor [Fusibacter sp. A2]NPE22340.1 response regulator transcription factor [Fusibacter sp. A1]RXV61113.1 DNA-binding response regulator [Fusibacter sp. A1]